MELIELQSIQRTLSDLTERFDGDELSEAIEEFGWIDLFRLEPLDALDALFTAQGRSGSWSSAFCQVLSGTSAIPGSDFGSVAVLVPPPGSQACGGPEGKISGLLVGAPADSDAVVAVTDPSGSAVLYGFESDQLSITPVHGLDAGLRIRRAQGLPSEAEQLAEGDQVRQWWSEVVAAGRRALSFELCGTMETMLALAVTHATDRHQFGRPVGSFQAVRHRLAECRVAATGAHAAARASGNETEASLASMTAKVVAGRAQKLVAAHCQQVLAGLGFTAEHPFHRFMFRATVVDRLLGSSQELATELGRSLLERAEPVRLANL